MVFRAIRKGNQTKDIPADDTIPAGWRTLGFVVVHSTTDPGGKFKRGDRVNATKNPISRTKALSIDQAINISKRARLKR
jgi:hypothetical protein